MQNFENIPKALQRYPQWVVWRLEDRGGPKPTKIPYTMAGKKASVTDPSTWTTFENILTVAHQFSGIGFVLTTNDPFAFIDLDKTDDDDLLKAQIHIHEEFASYSERSPSGDGLHIIVEGSMISGRRKHATEVYSDARYMTMTGNVFNNAPIVPKQELLTQLWAELGGGKDETIDYEDKPQSMDDQNLIDMACNAINGDKFRALWDGLWHDLYTSQSEADFAIIDMISFYSQNREQIQRLFHFSALGKRNKAYRQDYVDRMINRSFDHQVPEVDFLGIEQMHQKFMVENSGLTAVAEQVPQGVTPTKHITQAMPRGLLGQIAQFIYAASPRPVEEVGLAGAIGLMSGICGRAYNVSATGLNQYILLLAMTGVGKASISNGIDKLFNEVKKVCPSAYEFIGPGRVASGQALAKAMADNPCFVTLWGEFGMDMKRLAHPRATQGDLALKQYLLDVYMKSGQGNTMKGTVYADKNNNTKIVESPALTLLGESTPSSFYETLDESLIKDGLLPRFLVLEHENACPYFNKNHIQVKPDPEVVTKLSELCANALTVMQQNMAVTVNMTDEVENFLFDLDVKATDKRNGSENEVVHQLWSRVHLKVMKLGALVAVGIDPYKPIIELQDIQWAYNLIEPNVLKMIKKFEDGLVGNVASEAAQMQELIKIMSRYIKYPYIQLSSYGVKPEMHKDKVIGYSSLYKMLSSRAAFRNDRFGSKTAIKRAIDTLLESGDILEVGKRQVTEKYGKHGKYYVIVNFDRFR